MKTRLLLSLTTLYLLGGYRAALSDLGYAKAPTYGRSWFWGAQFHMFNEPRPTTTTVFASIRRNNTEVPVDLPALYPALREEGPSYARSRFLNDPERLQLFAEDLCRRSGGGVEVRLRFERVPKGGGPVEGGELGNWPCR